MGSFLSIIKREKVFKTVVFLLYQHKRGFTRSFSGKERRSAKTTIFGRLSIFLYNKKRKIIHALLTNAPARL